jgi:hypothetical protein
VKLHSRALLPTLSLEVDKHLSSPNYSTMPSSDDAPSSDGVGPESEYGLAYYKAQYEQLESDLAEFQASSKDIEAELEKDIEASEKRERDLQSKVEKLGYEVEEWKVSHLSTFRWQGDCSVLCKDADCSPDQI